MEQKELRELEGKCIQEQPPECIAACPIHVDARAFIRRVSQGEWDEAWKVLRKTMPFPGILGRICNAPCRKRCKRGEVGDPIQIHALERACVTRAGPAHSVRPLPGRGLAVAVVGSGLSGLTVAWDLARKGYQVTVHEPGSSLGGPLLLFDDDLLPKRVIQEETAILSDLGVELKFQAPADWEDFLPGLLENYGAVYWDLDAVNIPAGVLAGNNEDLTGVVPMTRATSLEGVFAGGEDASGDGSSWVDTAAQGRWAATSIDRYLQKVSPTAGREKEGPYATRLYTDITEVEPLPAIPIASPQTGYNPEEAMAEAKRCLQCECLECVKACAYLENYGGYPKKYAREIYNNESIVMGSRQANKMINSCSLCGLCEEICPENFAMQELCLGARQSMVRRDKMPPSAHEFALLDLQFSNSDRFTMARHEPGRSESKFVFFPGCQLSASSPFHVRAVYDYLRGVLSGGVGLFLGCCNAPAAWAGREELYRESLSRLRNRWTDLGDPQMILACSTCYQVFKKEWPQADFASLWEVLAQAGLPEGAAASPRPHVFALHDPCTTRHEPALRRQVRGLLDRLGYPVEELKLGRETTECCGFGGLMQSANPDLAREVVRRRAEESRTDYATYCAMCRDNLAAIGKRTVHLLDLIWPPVAAEPLTRPRPGWSERRENRARLKETILKELWGESTIEMEAHQKIILYVSQDVHDILEERRILIEDLQKVIHQAEKTGDKLVHPKTGRFRSSFKPINVTFWLEYSPEGEGFRVYNAYSHRMVVVADGR